MNNALASYQQTQVETVGQGEIVILLYDGAIRFLNQAKDRIEKKDFAGKGNAISRALDIIGELDSSLNMEKGGDIAQNLHSLYLFASTSLLKVNIKLDLELLDHVITMLTELKLSFEAIVNTPEALAAAEEIRMSRSHSTYVARNVTEAPSAGMGKSAANNAYQNVARNAGVTTSNTAQPKNPVQAAQQVQKKEIDTASIANFLAQNEQAVTGQVPQAQMSFATIEAPANVQMTAQAQQNTGGLDLQASLYNLRQTTTQGVATATATATATTTASPQSQVPPKALNNPLSTSLNT